MYLSGDAAYVNSLLMDGDAVIRGCNSRTSGGGLTAALRNNGDRVRLAGLALIEQNTATNGAGIYLRSYLAEVGGALSIGKRSRLPSTCCPMNQTMPEVHRHKISQAREKSRKEKRRNYLLSSPSVPATAS